MTDSKASEAEKARDDLHEQYCVLDECENGHDDGCVLWQSLDALIATVRAEQGGHVAHCDCHPELCNWCAEFMSGEHDHPYRDPRCGESIELIKAKARLDGAERMYGFGTYGGQQEGVIAEARAEVEKLEK